MLGRVASVGNYCKKGKFCRSIGTSTHGRRFCYSVGNINHMHLRIFAVLLAAAVVSVSAAECSFRSDPNAFLERQQRGVRDVFDRTIRASASRSTRASVEPASTLPRKSFIDEEIFAKLSETNVPSAGLSTDEEFVRRITLDLTGRMPSPTEIRAFVADNAPEKREALISKLVGSPSFNDKWTMWWGDLLENCQFPALFDRRENGRNAYYNYIKTFVEGDFSLRDVVTELITANGNHYDVNTGASNFSLTARTNMGPAQDTYDNGLVKAATYFLGMAQYDCLLCHNGRGHLEEVNLWGSRTTRMDAWKMAAHFSRLNMPGRNAPSTDFFYQSVDISERATGTYDLNTTTGNRPTRAAIGTLRNLQPEYRVTAVAPTDGKWREAFAKSLLKDPMFATNFVNRFWREFFGMGLVEPYDMLDPDRLDPAKPPAAPWTLQATHPVLLQKLAQEFQASDFNVRYLIKLIVRSNAYQMSSRYEGKWTLDMVPLFARHYPRRLWAEEVHDIITTASGDLPTYTQAKLPNVRYAMQLSDTDEPRSNGAVGSFLNSFLRGNRDSRQRSSDQTILQRMAIMNDTFVTNRTRAAAPNLAVLFKIADNKEVTEEIYLTFLGRKPSEAESQTAVKFLSAAPNATDRNNLLEDLVWTCINKADFVFSY